MSALIIVDVQNDFISGSLSISDCPAKHNGEEVRKIKVYKQYLFKQHYFYCELWFNYPIAISFQYYAFYVNKRMKQKLYFEKVSTKFVDT